MDSTNFEDFNSPAGGVELSDTLSSWRKKTNGIVMKIDSIESTANTLNSTVSALSTTVATSDVNNNSVALGKIAQIPSLKVLGNTSASTGNVSNVSIVNESGGITSNDNDTSIPTSSAVKDYVDNKFFNGQTVQQNVVRYDNYTEYSVEALTLSSGEYTTLSGNIVSTENFNRDGVTTKAMYAVRVPADISITPIYANSLICLEWNLLGEAKDYNSGFWISRKRADNKYEIINVSGYEGYNNVVGTARNNFYHPSPYDGNEASTPNMHTIRYFVPAADISEKTYGLIFGSAAATNIFRLNGSKTSSNNSDYERGVSNVTIKELYQV